MKSPFKRSNSGQREGHLRRLKRNLGSCVNVVQRIAGNIVLSTLEQHSVYHKNVGNLKMFVLMTMCRVSTAPAELFQFGKTF